MTTPSEPSQGTRVLVAFGETQPEMLAELHKAFSRFEEGVRGSQDHWLQAPSEGRWSPAQVAEHVLLVNENVGRLVALLLSDKALRPMERTPGHTQDGRRLAPANLEPSAGQPWEALSARWEASHAQLTGVGERLAAADLGRVAYHPFLGDLDVHDWFRMVTYHIRHHRRQLEEGQ